MKIYFSFVFGGVAMAEENWVIQVSVDPGRGGMGLGLVSFTSRMSLKKFKGTRARYVEAEENQ